MIAVKDVESLKGMAAILLFPLLSAAFFVDDPLKFQQDPSLHSGLTSSILAIKIACWALYTLSTVFFATFAIAFLDSCIIWLHVRSGDSFIMPWCGFAFITCGLMIFSFEFPNIPKLPVNPFWYLGFLAYGLSLVDRAAKGR